MELFSIGVDFGTTGGRAALVNIRDGSIAAEAYHDYKYGVMLKNFIDGSTLPENYAVIHPDDYLNIMISTIQQIMVGIDPKSVIGIGVDCSSCTMMPVKKDGTPLCRNVEFNTNPHAFAKVTRHRAAKRQAQRFYDVAVETNQEWLKYYNNYISAEWLFPKILETLEEAPEVYNEADYFMEATDWLAWQLTGNLFKTSYSAGFKAFYIDGKYPSTEYFTIVNSGLSDVLKKIDIPMIPSQYKAGNLTPEMAEILGLTTNTAVCHGMVDIVSSIIGVQAANKNKMIGIFGDFATLVTISDKKEYVDGINGPVPISANAQTYYYKAFQNCMGLNYAWFQNTLVPPEYHENARHAGRNLHSYLAQLMQKLKPGENGIIALNWLKGNSSLLYNKNLSCMFVGMTLDTKIEHMYRAVIEAMAFDTRKIKEALNSKGIVFDEIYGIGIIAERNPFIMQIYADVLGVTIKVAGSPMTPVLGSAALGAVAAGSENGGYDNIITASKAMGKIREDKIYHPIPENAEIYNKLYQTYCRLYDIFGKENPEIMENLRKISK